jgi:hypothetical protein
MTSVCRGSVHEKRREGRRMTYGLGKELECISKTNDIMGKNKGDLVDGAWI